MKQHLVVDPTAHTAVPQTSTPEAGDDQQRSAPEDANQPPIPEKYRGKTLEQIVEMHQHAEQEIGRQRNEVGTYRSLVDELITSKRGADLAAANGTSDDSLSEITSDALLNDPANTLTKVIESVLDKRLKPLEDSITSTGVRTEYDRLKQDFPALETTTNSEEFQAWVGRTNGRIADAQAAVNGDMRAARRLLEDYADFSESAVSQDRTTEKSASREGIEAARRAATESGGSADNVTGKKVWTQHEIVEMAIHQPDKYKSAAVQEEIARAIKEGRYKAG